MSKNPSKTAIHEIAHAYTAHMLGSKVEKVEIFDDDTGCLDVVHFGDPEPDPIVLCCVLIAGHEAECLLCGQDVHRVPFDDWKQLSCANISNTGANIVREPLVKFLKANKHAIVRLARLLNERRVIKRRLWLKEMRAIMGEERNMRQRCK